MYADLHIHSTYSDGTNSPEELIEIAMRNNVSAIAISDHDTLDGIKEAAEAAAKSSIQVIPAVEISTSVKGLRIHILGYNINCNNTDLKKYLKSMADVRTQNTRNTLKKLNALRVLNYSWEDVMKHKANKSWICSLDIFDAMRLDGMYKHRGEWKDFYYTYIKNGPGYFDMDDFTAKSAIEVILQAGGVPVAAHPKLIGDNTHLDDLVRYGLKGIEAYYPAHSEAEILNYVEYANKHSLITTGGTDWHGDFTEWKVKMGDYGIDYEKLCQLLKIGA